MRIRVLIAGLCASACTQGGSVTDGVASRRDFQAALARALPPGTPVAAAEARLRADGFACRAEDVPPIDTPDTLHALICEKLARDSAARRPWLAAVYHDHVRVDTVDVIWGGDRR